MSYRELSRGVSLLLNGGITELDDKTAEALWHLVGEDMQRRDEQSQQKALVYNVGEQIAFAKLADRGKIVALTHERWFHTLAQMLPAPRGKVRVKTNCKKWLAVKPMAIGTNTAPYAGVNVCLYCIQNRREGAQCLRIQPL